jgi:hypothetical protein
MIPQNCCGCRFWLANRPDQPLCYDHPLEPKPEPEHSLSTCSRFPPMVVFTPEGGECDLSFQKPITAGEDWCGEWRPA